MACDYLVETIKLLTISERNLKRRMVFKGTEVVDEVVENGQSYTLRTPLSAWDIVQDGDNGGSGGSSSDSETGGNSETGGGSDIPPVINP